MAYKLELLPKLKAHSVFHVNMLKPFHEDQDDLAQGESQKAPTRVRTSYEKEVESILANRLVRQKNYRPRHEYLVYWKGYPRVKGVGNQLKRYGNFKTRLTSSMMRT